MGWIDWLLLAIILLIIGAALRTIRYGGNSCSGDCAHCGQHCRKTNY